MSNPHVLAVPFPEPGHILPLMELCLSLVKHGVKITFVNTEFHHKRMTKPWTQEDEVGEDRFHLVSVQDGLESEEGRKQPGQLCEAIYGTMARNLEKLVEEINGSGEIITCVVADAVMLSAVEIAAKKGIRTAIFNPTAATTMTLVYNIPKLINDGIINSDGERLGECFFM